MLKKLFSMITVILICFTMCSCGPDDEPSAPVDPSPAPQNDPDTDPDTEDTDLTEEFYDALKGVWIRKDDMITFLAISNSSGQVCYTAGIVFSDYIFGGPLDSVTKDGTKYSFTVHVPERGDNELSSGWDAYDLNVTIDTADIASYKITANDYARDGKSGVFEYFYDDFETVNFDALFAGNEPMSGIDTDMAASLWKKLSGVWINKDTNNIFFLTFDVLENKYYVNSGIPNSGYGVSGTISTLSETSSGYEMTLDVPGNEATEVSDATEGFSEVCTLIINDDGSLQFTRFCSDFALAHWEYYGKDWDSVDYDQLYS